MTPRIAMRAEYVKTHDVYPAPVHVEYPASLEQLPEASRVAAKFDIYMKAQTVETSLDGLLTGHFRFDGSFPSELFGRVGHKAFNEIVYPYYYCRPKENLATFEWQHSTPDYSYVIRHGIRGYLDRIAASREKHADDAEALDFLSALESACRTIIGWANKCADGCEEAAKTAEEPRKSELLAMRDNLRRVPEHLASSFYEGVQALFLCFEFLPDSIGTIDRYLSALYDADIKSGALTRERAKEYLQDLFIRLQSHTTLGNLNRTRGGECHFAIGGYLPDGSDGFCDLSRLIVESVMELPLDIPQISLRRTAKTPREVLRFMMDCERNDAHKRIAFVNDDPRIKGFMNNVGVSYEDAVNHTMVGCNEPAFQGSVWMGGCTSNLARSLETTLYDRADEVLRCKTFDEFFTLYKRELLSDVAKICEYEDYFNELRAKDVNVVSSLFLEGCIENAKSATRGGCRIRVSGTNTMGLVCVIDSLSVIRQFVYDEKTVSMQTLLDALKANWEGYEDLHTMIMKKAKFFGNHEAVSDEVASRLTSTLHAYLSRRRLSVRGEEYRVLLGNLTGYHPHYAWFGANTKATPDGRYDGDAFMVGIGQTGGKDRNGLTALLSSVALFDPNGIYCGPTVTNVLLDEALIRNDAYFEKTVDMVEAYFKMGGLHIQLNYVTKEELLAAREHPETYASMKVRVSGFSGVFVTLREEIQNDIIARTEIKG